MRKIIFLMHVSLDGYVAGPNGEMDWIVYNQEIESYVHQLHASTDAAIYGRVTFDMMEGYWTTVLDDPNSDQAARNHAMWLDNNTKVVISRTRHESDWQNTLFINDNVVAEIQKMKQQPGKDMWLLASASVAQLFMQHNLIDEYWLNINPVMLGGGKPLYGTLDQSVKLKLIASQTMQGGVIATRYAPEK